MDGETQGCQSLGVRYELSTKRFPVVHITLGCVVFKLGPTNLIPRCYMAQIFGLDSMACETES